jgi:type III restriction enzyme
MPLAERGELDVGLPVLTPALVRKRSLAEEIAGLDVMGFSTILLPLTREDAARRTFRYEGYDIITLERLVEREYQVPEPQTAQEVIGYYARRIGEQVKLPAQFAALAPKVREFFEFKAFGQPVDLDARTTVKAMSTPVAHYVCVSAFRKELQALSIEERRPELLEPERRLSVTPPFPWSRPVLEARHTVFNLIACENDFERAFAKFLDAAPDVARFAKLPRPFGFAIEYTDAAMNLRCYYPDFVAVDAAGTHWLLETKGQESAEVGFKDRAATQWCENATTLTGTAWQYRKIPQKEFEGLRPRALADLEALG